LNAACSNTCRRRVIVANKDSLTFTLHGSRIGRRIPIV
jgi:hypothetical protein